MTDSLRHRGPDGEGQLIRPAGEPGWVLGLGHRRLAILDLSEAGRQPMRTPDGSAWLVFNGEIYNFWELRRELEAHGECFVSRCDTEVLLRLLSLKGVDALEQLNGMWALAFWDERRKRLVLSRDRIGIKPLYYHQHGDMLVFGSEIKALLSAGVSREVRQQGVTDYLRYGYSPDPDTIYRDIKQLEAGCYLVYQRGQVEIRRYWDLRASLERRREAQAEELLEQLDRSVRARLLSDVPLGAFLSGGIDSSAIVASMRATGHDEVRTFCISFPDARLDESRYARLMADHVKSSHREFTFAQEGINIVHKALRGMDEPFADDALLPTYLMCQLARSEVKVALSGDGGDETFAGYDKYRTEKVAEYLGRPTHWLLSLAESSAGAASHLPMPTGFRDRLGWLQRMLASARLSPPERFESKLTVLNADTARALTKSHTDGAEDRLAALLAEPDAEDFTARMFYADVRFGLVNNMLRKVDRMSMAWGLEVRVPFLDHNLVEFAAALPSRQRIRGLRGKYLLRQAIRRRLPRSLLWRRKQGFDVPIDRWFRGSLVSFVRETLTARAVGHHGLLDWKGVERILMAHESGRSNLSRVIFALLTFQMWYESYIRDQAFAPPSDHPLARPQAGAAPRMTSAFS